MAGRVGLQAVAYTLPAGTARATWATSPDSNNIYTGAAPASLSPINVIRNLTLNGVEGEADLSSRKSFFKLTGVALEEIDVDIEMVYDPTDTNFVVLRNARTGRHAVPVLILDGSDTSSGNFGLWADFVVTEWTREEPLDKEMMVKCKLKPTDSGVVPQWVVVN